ncbi:MAG: ornithine cyclodeaminase family protein [Bryobacteraceae bacterium]
MPGSSPLWISEADVVAMMDIREAIDALELGLLAEAHNEARNMVKTHIEWGDGSTLHAIGAVFAQAGFAGTKTWTHTPGGATPLLILFDAATGALKAIVEAFALGQMRTGGASGVATRWLAAEDAGELAMIGTGKQAITQVAAVLAVRPIRRVRVYGRDEKRREQFAKRVETELGIEAVAADTIGQALKDAPIVTVATRATEPIIVADMCARGTHINAIGAIVPSRAEIAADVLARSSQIVADSIPQAQKLSRELIAFFGPDPSKWERVQSLAALVAARRPRSPSDDLTLFKALGIGISDLSLGIQLYRKALASGIGRELPNPQKKSPRLRAMQPLNISTGA